MQAAEAKVDGNAIGGLLGEIFTMEMTTAETTCASCGAVNPVGRVDVYLTPQVSSSAARGVSRFSCASCAGRAATGSTCGARAAWSSPLPNRVRLAATEGSR